VDLVTGNNYWVGMCAAPNGNIYAAVYGGSIWQGMTMIYAAGARVIVISSNSHKIYESLIDNNFNNSPPTSSTKWLLIGSTNRWKAFDGTLGTQTSQATSIVFVLTPGAIDSIALLNIESTSVQIQMSSGGSSVYDTTITTGTSKTDIVKLDLPQNSNCILTVTINYTAGTAKIGELIVGIKTSLGTMKYSPSIGITNYSTKTVDVFGHYSIVPRAKAKRLICNLIILNTNIDEIIRLLTLYIDTELVWVGSESYNSLIVCGFCKDFNIVIPRPLSSDCSIEIEGLT